MPRRHCPADAGFRRPSRHGDGSTRRRRERSTSGGRCSAGRGGCRPRPSSGRRRAACSDARTARRPGLSRERTSHLRCGQWARSLRTGRSRERPDRGSERGVLRRDGAISNGPPWNSASDAWIPSESWPGGPGGPISSSGEALSLILSSTRRRPREEAGSGCRDRRHRSLGAAVLQRSTLDIEDAATRIDRWGDDGIRDRNDTLAGAELVPRPEADVPACPACPQPAPSLPPASGTP